MRKCLIQLVCVGLVGVSVAGAGPLIGSRTAVEQGGTNKAALFLAWHGITNAADREAITSAWDEDAFIDVATKYRAFGLIAFVLNQDKLAAASMERIKAAVLDEKTPPANTPELALNYPVSHRDAFKSAVATVCAKRYAAQPEYGRLVAKYLFQQGITFASPSVAEDDLAAWLLAPEPMALSDADAVKRSIKEHAIVLARAVLRSEGKSFVAKDGVNPLAAKVQPVVDALNAPVCEGLETALRGLGADVRDYDRNSLVKFADTWREPIMRGDLSASEAGRYLGKMAIVLGTDGYNRFVDEYNNGKAGGK